MMTINSDENRLPPPPLRAELTPVARKWYIRSAMLTGAVILLIALGWYMVLRQTQILTQTAITLYQQTELEIVRTMARSVNIYLRNQVEEHGRTDIAEIEQEIFELFIAPVHLLENGDAWIYAPDHVVFDRSSDFPEAYRGKSMAQIFALQVANGASHYQEMTEAVMNAREGVGWYIWLPDKGKEIAAWTPVRVGEYTWTIGLSTPLPEILASTGAAGQMQTLTVTMGLGTFMALLLLFAWGHSTIQRQRTDRAWQESEQKFRSIVERSRDGIVLLDEQGVIIEWNRSQEQITGLKQAEVIGQPIWDVQLQAVPKKYKPRQRYEQIKSSMKQLLETGQSPWLNQLREIEIEHADGTLRTIQQASFTIETDKGYMLSGVSRDITERVQAEEALRESEERFKILFEFAPDAYYLSDLEGEFIDGNRAVEKLLGYKREELIGKNFLEVNLLPSAEISRAAAVLSRNVAGQQPTGPNEFVLNHRDGSQVTVEISTFPVEVKGQTVVLGIARDITKRKQAEAALRRRNRELTLLNRVGQEISATLDTGQISERLLQAVVETIGAESASVWLWDEPQAGWLICRAVFRQDRNRSLVNLRLEPGQGVAGWVAQTGESAIVSNVREDPRFFSGIDELTGFCTRSLLSVPLRVRDEIIGVLEVANKLNTDFEVDDRILAETLAASAAIAIQNARLVETLQERTAELQARNEDLNAFAHTVAHDLKQPLGHMVGFAELLEQDYASLPDEELQHYLHTIARSGRKMVNIIDELLLLAGVRRMKKVEIEPLDMASIVSKAQNRLADLIKDYQARVIVPADWPVALGYAPWVEEVWVNYISNALKYGGQPPRVELGANQLTNHQLTNQPMIRFWVRDDGTGLMPEEQTRLFTPFTRLDQTRAKGHGLGLSIVRRIVERLGGQVGVESAIDVGSIFWFTLPVK